MITKFLDWLRINIFGDSRCPLYHRCQTHEDGTDEQALSCLDRRGRDVEGKRAQCYLHTKQQIRNSGREGLVYRAVEAMLRTEYDPKPDRHR